MAVLTGCQLIYIERIRPFTKLWLSIRWAIHYLLSSANTGKVTRHIYGSYPCGFSSSPSILEPPMDAPADVVKSVTQIRIHHYLYVVAFACLFYDHVITLDAEIKYVWRRNKNANAYLFFVNRYFAFVANIIVFIPRLGEDVGIEALYTGFTVVRELLLIFSGVFICVLLTLRIYALYERSRRMLIFFVCFLVSGIAVSIFVITQKRITRPDPVTGCELGLSRENAYRNAAVWECLLLFDTVVFGFILYRIWSDRRRISLAEVRIPLRYVLLRDGVVYYAIMVLVNLANILTFYIAEPLLRGCLSTLASNYNDDPTHA
ncbi:unnamed protein product [Cyclocybe aegerita]|uniref:DUF6533 domain-containing protein n=1 Tax=Cyclocybe aegerita TaxID=1973307 RepID=A0A8S0X7R7_CYCAE|nr:unnamed protein product [Cyclocybe aegerita]